MSVASIPILAVISDPAEKDFATQVANSLGYKDTHVVIGTPLDAADHLRNAEVAPLYILIDIGNRSYDVLPELDEMAEHCSADARVVITGSVNDVNFYRELKQRGVIEYFTRPAKISDIRTALVHDTAAQKSLSDNSKVITFVSAASGDGASTLALATAYCLSTDFNQSVAIVDMDYQFGMMARSLDLSSQFGIRELLEHQDRKIDSTLLDKMMVSYRNSLKIIPTPTELRYMPEIKPESIRDLILTLRSRFDFVIIDLPHIWAPWCGAALSDSNKIMLVTQLWLKSVTHAARLLHAYKDIGLDLEKVGVIVNRSGAKFKEALSPKDFERVCSKPIEFYIANDIRTVSSAENEGKTIFEVGNTVIARQVRELATLLAGSLKGIKPKTSGTQSASGDGDATSKDSSLLKSLFSKK
jgi:pilus assembly protein CpaE